MDVFFGFGCNICYKTDDGSLKNISEENMKHLKDTLITFVGHADIIKYNEIYLCQFCCDELIRFDKFRELCYSHLIQSPQKCFNMLSTLDLEGGNMLKTFVHEKNSVLKCDKFRVAFTNEEDIKNVIRRSEHTKLETFDISNVSDTSQIQFMKEEIDLNYEIENPDSEIFTLSSFENKSSEQANLDVKEPVVSDSSDSMKQELHVKPENSNAEGVILETIEDEDGVHVAFEIANVCTIVNVGNRGNEDIGNQEDKIGRKLRSRRRNNVDGNIGDIENNTFAGKGANETTCNRRQADVQRKGPHMCQHCHKQFPTPSLLIIHMRTHTGDRPYRCTICDKAFTTNSNLHTHARTHTNVRPYKCNVCEKTFTLNCSLTTHQRIHTNTRPYKCTQCSKTFTKSGVLTVHMRVHTGQRPYKCTVCDMAFTKNTDLTVHMRVHTGQRPYKCTVCDMAFTHSSSLTVHMRVHTGQRPYKCTVCDMAFTHSSNLTVHMRVHTGQRPYKCTVCGMEFTHSCSLTRHMRVHTGQRPYKCTACDKAFTQCYSLTKHKRTHGNTFTKPTR